mgnify:CR=1 FL=1
MKNFQWQKFPKVQKVQKVQKVHSALPEIIWICGAMNKDLANTCLLDNERCVLYNKYSYKKLCKARQLIEISSADLYETSHPTQLFLLQLQSSHFSADTCFRNTNNHLANKQSDKTLLSLSSVLYHAFLNNHAESFSRGDTVNFLNFLNLLNF